MLFLHLSSAIEASLLQRYQRLACSLLALVGLSLEPPYSTAQESALNPRNERSQPITDARRRDGPDASDLTRASTEAPLQNLSNRGEFGAAARAKWLAVKFDAAAQFNEFAIPRISDPDIREFAKANSSALSQFEQRFSELALPLQGSAQLEQSATSRADDEEEVDLSETAKKIGEAVQGRLRARADNATVGPGGQGAVASETPQANGADGNNRRGARERRNAQRAQPVADDLVATLDGSPDGPRRARRDRDPLFNRNESGGGAVRAESSRDRVRVLLPALRERLPEILELVGEAIEDDDPNSQTAWVRYESKLADAELEVMERELAGFHGGALDRAYLGMALNSTLELQAAIDVAAQEAGPELRGLASEAMQVVRGEVQREHRLIEKLNVASTNPSEARGQIGASEQTETVSEGISLRGEE